MTLQLESPPRRKVQRSNSMSPATTSTRPPAQVYTRGTVGAVKTRGILPTASHDPLPVRQTRQDDVGAAHQRMVQPQTYQIQASDTTFRLRPATSEDPEASSVHSAVSAPNLSLSGKPHFRVEPSRSKERSDDSQTRSSQEEFKLHMKIARKVIDDLNRAQGADRRIAAITNACASFDHDDESKHNIELYHGAAQALAKLLINSNSDDVNRMICSALEMVFRGTAKSVQAAYDRIGSNLLTHLLRLLERCESGGMKHGEISALNISWILLYLSRCPDLRPTLCRHKDMLSQLIKNSAPPLRPPQSPECRHARMRILANLSNCEENRILMYEQMGLLENVLRVAHFDTSDQIRQHAASCLMNMASAPANQVAMAKNDKLMGTLVKMILIEKSETTRDHVVTAIQNLAFAKENRERLVDFKQGIVLEALKKSLSADPDPKVRRRSAGALTNLACETTAEHMGNHKGLLNALAIVATKDDSMDVQTRASLALTKIAGSVTVAMECHEALLDALVVASLSKAANSVSAVIRVKAREPVNREALGRHTGILDTLADIIVSDSAMSEDRDNAVRAIMHLVNETTNQKIMCNRMILGALVKAANYKDPDLEEARDSAIRAMQRMVTSVANRETMAHHEGLLTAVAKAVEREDRWMSVGRESEHGYLAKALLMSLLVAM